VIGHGKTRVNRNYVLAIATIGVLAILLSFALGDEGLDNDPILSAPVLTEPSSKISLPDSTASAPLEVNADKSDFVPSTGNMFESVDPSLIDDSIVQKNIEGASINRYRVVEINSDTLRDHMRGEKASQDIHLPLFENLTIMGRPIEALEYHSGQRRGFGSWSGTVNGDGKSLLSIVVYPSGKTDIDIVGDQGVYRVFQLDGTPYHIIVDANLNISFEGDTQPSTPN